MPDHWQIILRLFAATEDPSVAETLAGVVASKAGRFGQVRSRPVEPYWKIPEYYEIGIELRPVGDSSEAYEGMLVELATGWERQGSPDEPWAIWNPSAECRCFSPLVRWMSLSAFRRGVSPETGEDTNKFDFHEKVIVAASNPDLAEIHGELGTVSGMAYGKDGRWSYAVSIHRTGLCGCIMEDDLHSTGEFDFDE
ncbi:hypothetical protein P12x_002894 [Tundrisphaera lichenicola]|uniref:hypothetical protein n=1 Tax=Tundrisphaera lichenicola TaxID=2029860 RepID=UPI003EBA0BE2